MNTLRGAWKSWTIRVNALCGMIVAGLPLLQDSVPALQPYIDGNMYRYAMGSIVAANILLRFRTSTCLADKK